MINVAVLLTVYNRRVKTLSCLKALFEQVDLPNNVQIKVLLVDDNSQDDTSAAIAKYYPQVLVLQGGGNLYWSGGMRLAFGEALKEGFDYYLWLNDDTMLYPTSLAKLLEISHYLKDQPIIAASIKDPERGQLIYGGVKRMHHWRPLKFTLIPPGEKPIPVETMNGNCVLIPDSTAQRVGNLDKAFTHGMGDFDYGLRAHKLGYQVYLSPGYYGECQQNHAIDTHDPFFERWKKLLSPRGLPPREWAVFARRYAGPFWPFFWIATYIKRLL